MLSLILLSTHFVGSCAFYPPPPLGRDSAVCIASEQEVAPYLFAAAALLCGKGVAVGAVVEDGHLVLSHKNELNAGIELLGDPDSASDNRCRLLRTKGFILRIHGDACTASVSIVCQNKVN